VHPDQRARPIEEADHPLERVAVELGARGVAENGG
jgi:hypothetical protein